MPIQIGSSREHGFDQPLGLLSDCHRRIEYFLRILRTIASDSPPGPLPEDYRDAAESALKYFQTAALRHNQDEEQSLFPRLRKCPDLRIRTSLEALQSLEKEHVTAAAIHHEVHRMYRQWIDGGLLPDADRAVLDEYLDDLACLYQRHIELEDSRVFPLAAEALDAGQLQCIGAEMAHRRGLKIPDAASSK